MRRASHWLRGSLLLAAAVLLCACATTPRVISARDESIDFTNYISYAYMAPLASDIDGVRSLASKYLIEATDIEMRARGYQRIDNPDAADLLINFSVTSQEKTRVRGNTSVYVGYGVPLRYRTGLYGAWQGYQPLSVEEFTEGTLTVDVVDRALNQLVWDGTVRRRLTDNMRENLRAEIMKTIPAIFARFPTPLPPPATAGP